MRIIISTLIFSLLSFISSAQSIKEKLQAAYQQFEADTQMRHAISSLYVINASTGEVVFDKNSQIGLAGASTQKIITATTAFELLGKDYRYKTEIGYKGKIERDNLKGFLYIIGSGDPTLGSWRYESTKPEIFYSNLMAAIKNGGIKNDSFHKTFLLMDLSRYASEVYNDNWVWQDLANYYGISSCALNWRENQFDAIINPGKEGDPVKKIRIFPSYVERRLSINDQLFTGKERSGDNSYFYLSPGTNATEYALDLKGTIPAGVDSFTVSASHPDPPLYFSEFLLQHESGENFENSNTYPLFGAVGYFWGGDSSHVTGLKEKSTQLYNYTSPPLDSIIYWFLKRSINLYGEALIKTFAYEKNHYGSTDSGVVIVKNFWKQKGLDPEEINIKDGSGLSPQNRITTHAQVEILKYAKQQSWFPYFFDALPEFNKMKMKSGTINDVKGFCGYHTSGDGTQYIFSFLVNNYSGRSSTIVNKMYKVLDTLK